ncbi:MAG: hypothetical protein AAGH15_28985, partial [Myxococcota bacterium]
MRVRTILPRRAFLAGVLMLGLGCAGRTPAPADAAEIEAREAEARRAEERREAEERRRLESELALARAENERLRNERQVPGPPRETVRIGQGRDASLFDDPEAGEWSEPGTPLFEDEGAGGWSEPPAELEESPAPRGPRPVLRLHGEPPPPEAELGPLPPLPPATAPAAGAPRQDAPPWAPP